jgi:DnaJ-domain-containing protein 1
MMAYTINSQLSWSAEEDKLYETLIKWGADESSIKIEAGRRGSRALAKQQSPDERRVHVQFWLGDRQYRLSKDVQARSVDNLAHLRILLDRIRLIELADGLDILKDFARQLTAPVDVADPFAELGLPADAGIATIKGRYRNLAAEHHPDRTGGTVTERWLRINQAYADLRQQMGF